MRWSAVACASAVACLPACSGGPGARLPDVRLTILDTKPSPEQLVVTFKVETNRDAYVACASESCAPAIQPIRARFAAGTLRVVSALSMPDEGKFYVAPPRVAFRPIHRDAPFTGTVTVHVPVTVVDTTATPAVRSIPLSSISEVALELGVLPCDDARLASRVRDGILRLGHDFVIECHGRQGMAIAFQSIKSATAPVRSDRSR